MSDYLHVQISAEDKKQSNAILNALLEKKLVTGGQIVQAPARFWWKGEIVDMGYCFIHTFTLSKLKSQITSEVKNVSVEEIPMISFIPFEGNEKFTDWIEKTLS